MAGTYPKSNRSYAGNNTYTGRSIRPYSVPSYIGRPTPSNDNTAGASRPRQKQTESLGPSDEYGEGRNRAKRMKANPKELIGTYFHGIPPSLNRIAARSMYLGSVIHSVTGMLVGSLGYTHPGHIFLYGCGGPNGVRGPIATSGCFLLQAIAGSAKTMTEAYTNAERTSGFSTYFEYAPEIQRYRNVESWGLPSPLVGMPLHPTQFPYPATQFPGVVPTIPGQGWAGRYPIGLLHPSVNPMFLFPGAPMPAPWAIPHTMQPYYRPPGAIHNPVHGTMRGNAVPAGAPIWAPPALAPVPPGMGIPPVPPGYVGPGLVLVPGLYGGWGRVLSPAPWRKPPPGTKQKKIAIRNSSLAGLVFKVGAFTEALDAIDAVYQALPEKLRKREQAKRHGKDPWAGAKLRLLFNNLGSLDGPGAIENLINENIQDHAIAKANRIGRMAGPYGDGRGSQPTRMGAGGELQKNSPLGDLKLDIF